MHFAQGCMHAGQPLRIPRRQTILTGVLICGLALSGLRTNHFCPMRVGRRALGLPEHGANGKQE